MTLMSYFRKNHLENPVSGCAAETAICSGFMASTMLTSVKKIDSIKLTSGWSTYLRGNSPRYT